MNCVKYLTVIFCAIFITSCGDDGSSCSVEQIANGSQIKCDNGTVSTVTNGQDGSPAPADNDVVPTPSASPSPSPSPTPKSHSKEGHDKDK